MNILYGKNIIYNILKMNSNIIDLIYIINSDKKTDEIITEATKKKIPYIFINKYYKKNINYLKKNSIISKMKKFKKHSDESLLNIIEKNKNPLFLLLDRIKDPNNLGACIRTAEVSGVTAIIITKDKTTKLSPLISKISCGTSYFIPIIITNNLVKILTILKEHNIFTLGMSTHASSTIYEKKLNIPLAIIMGSESNGIKTIIKNNCDDIAKIPTFGNCKSLNVSTATGITLYEIQRQKLNL